MRKLLIFIGAFFLCGCSFQIFTSFLPSTEELEIIPNVPFHIILNNSKGEAIGIAVPIYNNIFVTADHLREKEGDLFWKDKKLEVLIRDFDNNLLFLYIESWPWLYPEWSGSPPAVGEKIFWIDGMSVNKEEVHSLSQTIKEDQIQKDIISISGVADLYNSGSPIFGQDGRVYGILIGADNAKNMTFATRSDVILRILQEE